MLVRIITFVQFLLSWIFMNYNIANIEKEEYAAILKIPSISVNQYLYDKDDERNNLDERLIFLNASATPEEKGGNVIIAGHSGFGNISYFKNLYKVKIKDTIQLIYHGKEYVYEVVNRYKVPKTGEVEIIRDPNVSSITLITCYGLKEQLVVIGKQL